MPTNHCSNRGVYYADLYDIALRGCPKPWLAKAQKDYLLSPVRRKLMILMGAYLYWHISNGKGNDFDYSRFRSALKKCVPEDADQIARHVLATANAIDAGTIPWPKEIERVG